MLFAVSRSLRLLWLPLAACTFVATAALAAPRNPAGFVIHRGVNLSHWLSQCPDSLNRAAYITEPDFAYIRRIGYDHVRIPIDEIELWTPDGKRIDAAFQVLITALDWARKHDLRAIVDLHTVRAHHFNSEYGENTLWTDPAAQQKFLRLWNELIDVLGRYPIDWVAYEIMNEPVADDPQDWNKLVAKAVAEIRKREPKRVLVIGSNKWQQAATFPALEVPAGDRNIILSVHNYDPFGFTHHRASWTKHRDYTGPVRYPGPTITRQALAGIKDESVRESLAHAVEPWDRARFIEAFRPAVEKARALDLQLYCGEFGCLPTVPRADRLKWYADIVSVLEELGLAWANWEYKAEFGIISYDFEKSKASPPDEELIRVLLGK